MTRSRLALAGRAAARALAAAAAVLQSIDLPDGPAARVLHLFGVAVSIAAAVDGLRHLGRSRGDTVQRTQPTTAEEVPGAGGTTGDGAQAGSDR